MGSKEAVIATCYLFLVDNRQDVAAQLGFADMRFTELEIQAGKARVTVLRGLHITCVRHVPIGAESKSPPVEDPFDADDPYIAFQNKLRNTSRTKSFEHQVDFTDPDGLYAVMMAIAEEMNVSNEQYVSADYSSFQKSFQAAKTVCCAVQ